MQNLPKGSLILLGHLRQTGYPKPVNSSSQPSSALEVANKFTVLGSVPKPSYQTALVTTHDPLASSPQRIATYKPKTHGKPSPYHQKPP
jgi:hypothetical protein